MTAYTITINPRAVTEVNITPETRRLDGSLQITGSKQQAYQTASFVYHDIDKTDYTNITIGDTIEIEVNNILEFEGFISNIRKHFTGGIKLEITCAGNTFELERYLTTENVSYTGETTAAIAISLCDTYSYRILDTSNIDSTDGVTVQSITFNAETLNTCLQRLTELDGYSYYVGLARQVL
jgi:hypothetical protein